jgi:hypothetical protein
MPISQRRINDLASLVSAADSPRDTVGLYLHKQLDPFYDIALAVSVDFFARPQMYTKVSPRDAGAAHSSGEDGRDEKIGLVETLARLKSRCGSDELLPSHAQRAEIYYPIFGAPGESTNFDKLRDDLIEAATAYAERVFDSGVDMLRERVRTAHRPLKDFLLGLTGDSTDWSVRRPLATLSEGSCFAILRDPGINSVFGIVTPPRSTWPYLEDSNGDKLLEEVTSKLDPTQVMTRQEASSRQRLAVRGAEALAAVLDYTENSNDVDDDIKSLDVLITQCYTWGSAKKALYSR